MLDAINIVHEKFVKEKRPRCVSTNGRPVYQNEAGERCAYGWLCNDEQIRELAGFVGTVEAVFSRHSFPLHKNVSFACMLQSCHDTHPSRPVYSADAMRGYISAMPDGLNFDFHQLIAWRLRCLKSLVFSGAFGKVDDDYG